MNFNDVKQVFACSAVWSIILSVLGLREERTGCPGTQGGFLEVAVSGGGILSQITFHRARRYVNQSIIYFLQSPNVKIHHYRVGGKKTLAKGCDQR